VRGKVSSIDRDYIAVYGEGINDGLDYDDEVIIRKVSVTPIEEIEALKEKVQDLRYGLDQAIRDIKTLHNEINVARQDRSKLQTDASEKASNLARRIASLEQSIPSYQPLWNERIETLDARLDHMDEAIKSLSVQRAQEISADLKKDAARRSHSIHTCTTCKYANSCAIRNAIDYDRSCRRLSEGKGGCSEWERAEEAYVADRDDIDRYEAE